jgi:hypothetical protein
MPDTWKLYTPFRLAAEVAAKLLEAIVRTAAINNPNIIAFFMFSPSLCVVGHNPKFAFSIRAQLVGDGCCARDSDCHC